jgi:hypothetical protein
MEMTNILSEALLLGPSERADLAAALLASLDEQEDAEAGAARDAAVAQRDGEIDSGKVAPISSDEFWRRVKADAG